MATPSPTAPGIPKTPSGIPGLDEIMGGGLPKGRTILLCGSAGCGKTLFGMQFLVQGATQCQEPGVFLSFEETSHELVANVSSLGFPVQNLIDRGQFLVDHIPLDSVSASSSGTFNLEGLFIRLDLAIRSVGAKRVVIDTIEMLFARLPDEAVLRAEFRRLLRWLSEQGVTAIVTAERGEKTITRLGIEEYVSDCVIMLDHRVLDQLSTRRLRIVKYRGSEHGTNEYPFLIDSQGIAILPVTSAGLDHEVSNERVSSGVPALDAMLGGNGYYRGSSVLISGTAGSGKTSLAAHFAHATCARGERVMHFLFEESPQQLMRNMGSIGLNLKQWVDRGLLSFHAARPALHGLEMHLSTMILHIRQHQPRVVIIDPISSFGGLGNELEVKAMLVRLIDHLKVLGITTLMTDLSHAGGSLETTNQEISSLIDTWLLLRDIESNGERNRGMYILKSRGMSHSNQIREFTLSSQGVSLLDVYVGSAGVLTGSSRISQEAREEAEALAARQEIERQELALLRKREALESRIAALRAEFAADEADAERLIGLEIQREQRLKHDRQIMANRREAGH